MKQTAHAKITVLPIISQYRRAFVILEQELPTVLGANRVGWAALEGCEELAKNGAGLINPDGKTPTKTQISQFLSSEMQNTQDFHDFILTL